MYANKKHRVCNVLKLESDSVILCKYLVIVVLFIKTYAGLEFLKELFESCFSLSAIELFAVSIYS